MHARTQIRHEIITAVTGLGMEVFNARVFPLYDYVLPAVSVLTRDETVDNEVGRLEGLQARELTASLVIHAKAVDTLDDDLDGLAELVETAMFSSPFLTSGKIRCFDLGESTIEVNADGETKIGIMTIEFSLKYMTQQGFPTVII